jgi:hypothetical protein
MSVCGVAACLRGEEKKKMRRKMIERGMSNSAIASIDLGDNSSLATILSPGGEIAEIESHFNGYELVFTRGLPQ